MKLVREHPGRATSLYEGGYPAVLCDSLVLLGAGILVLFMFGPVIFAVPSEAHTMIAMEHGVRHSLFHPFDLGHSAGIRYLIYYSFVVQNRLSGVLYGPYILFNVATILVCLGLFYVVALRLTASRLAAVLATMIFAGHEMWYHVVDWLTGRQASLAIAFGLAAFLSVMENARLGARLSVALVAIFLSASFLSKDYGIVFWAGIVTWVIVNNVRPWAAYIPALIAVPVLFVVLQLLLPPDASSDGAIVCYSMGYFDTVRERCSTLDLLDIDNLKQLAYNFAVGLYSIVVPPVFEAVLRPIVDDSSGRLIVDNWRAGNQLFAAGCLVLFVAALVSDWKRALPLAVLVLGNAALLAFAYRTRNSGVGFSGSALMMAVGFSNLALLVGRMSRRPKLLASFLVGVAIVGTTALLIPHAERMRRMALTEFARRGDPVYACDQVRRLLTRVNYLNIGYRSDESVLGEILSRNGFDYDRRCR